MGPGNGLIIAFVVAVWAAYFVPLALRRYDDASKNASVETSGVLSRVISRRSEVAEADETDAPIPEAAASTSPTIVDKDRPAARLAARHRRRTLLTLLAALAIVGGLAGFSMIPVPWIAAPGVLVVAWLVACRIQVRGELGLSRTRSRRLRARHDDDDDAAADDDEEQTVVVSGQFEDINPGRKHQMEDVPLAPDALEVQLVIAVPSVSTTGEALWDPLPVTLPTYVTKPRAGRTVRTIDFGSAGAWTSGHIEGEDVELPARTDGAGDERRAVGH